MNDNSRHPFLYAISMLAMASLSSCRFVHPGMLHTEADLTRMAQKVAANASPWIDSYNILINNWHTGSGESSHAQTFINRGTGCTPDNIADLFNDVAAVYQLSLLWKIKGNDSYAAQAVGMMNSWVSRLTGIDCENGSSHDYILAAGIQGYQLANAAEILRNYSGWNTTEFAAFQKMMINVFLPINEEFPRSLSEYANWDLACYASIMAIGILTDNTTLFNQAVDYYKTGSGNGAIAQAVTYIHPGYLGQGQEAGRDQGHNTLDIAHLGVIAEMAWNQGIDLYGYGNNRLLALSEYTAKGNLIESTTTTSTYNSTINTTTNTTTYNYYQVPFSTYSYVNWPTVIYYTIFSTSSIGTIRPCWASIYNHYVNRKGLAANYTGIMMKLVAPDGGGGNYGSDTGGYDQLGFQTLTFTRDPISQGAAPSSLSGYLFNGSVVLSWWGSAYATSYSVRRGSVSLGPYTTIATGVTGLLSYTDSGLAPGTYYYIVAVNTSTTIVSSELKVVANPQAQQTYLTFDATTGTDALDVSENRNYGTLVGNVTFVQGKIGNGILLDGSSGYVNLPAGLITSVSDFTIATWLHLNSRSSRTRLFDFGYGTGRWMMFTPQGDNGNASFAITVNTAYGIQVIDTSTPVPVGVWTHIAITLNGTVGKIYLNGSVIGNSSAIQIAPFQLTNCTDLLAQNWLGRSQYSGSSGSDPYLNGIIDDFRIYQGALTADQIADLVNVQAWNTYLTFDASNGTVASDASGNGNDGNLVGNATFVAGKINNAVSLDGNTGYISLPAGLITGLSDFTIASWVKLNTLATWSRLFDFGYGTDRWMMFTPQASTGKARFAITISGDTGKQYIDGSGPLPVEQWVHVAVTLSGNVVTYYQNGSVAANGTISLSPLQLNEIGLTPQLWIGRSQYSGSSGSDPYLNGSVDDFRIYQGALTASEIAALASQQILNTYLTFDESLGVVAADSSGSGNYGILKGDANFVTGKIGNAVLLDGSTGYVSLPPSVIASLSNFTITSWLYLNNRASWARLFDFGYGTGRWMMFTPQGTNGNATFQITVNGNGNLQAIYSSSPVPVGQWIHVAITLSGNVGTYYLNGTVAGSNTITLSPLQLIVYNLTPQFWLGRSQYPADPYLNGTIDDFRVYPYALTAAQIAALVE